jgi:hypothetical protein
MKSRALLLYTAVSRHVTKRMPDFGDTSDAWEQSAAEYDVATRVELPDDAEAFLAECEKYAATAEGAHGFTRLCALAREQARQLQRKDTIIERLAKWAGVNVADLDKEID